MVKARTRRALAALFALLWMAPSALASAIPSRATDDAAVEASGGDGAAVDTFLARDDVRRALGAAGLTSGEVERRLEQLSAEDMQRLAANLDQLQAAGGMPTWGWILVAIGIAWVIAGLAGSFG